MRGGAPEVRAVGLILMPFSSVRCAAGSNNFPACERVGYAVNGKYPPKV